MPRGGISSHHTLDSSRSPDRTHSQLPLSCLPVGYSGGLQNQLARTPAPFEFTDDGHGSSNKREAKDVTAVEQNASQPESLAERRPDSRRYLIQRQQSQARKGQKRRMSTQRLPFENTDISRQTCHMATTISQHSQQIQLLMSQHSLFEPYTIYGNLAMSLPFRSISDTEAIQRPLKLSIHSWMKREAVSGYVEYTLQSEAKGKYRAE